MLWRLHSCFSIRCAGKGVHGPTLILHATHATIASIGVDMYATPQGASVVISHGITKGGVAYSYSLAPTITSQPQPPASCLANSRSSPGYYNRYGAPTKVDLDLPTTTQPGRAVPALCVPCTA